MNLINNVIRKFRDIKTIASDFYTNFLKLDGSNANSDINIGEWGFKTEGTITVGKTNSDTGLIDLSNAYDFPTALINTVIKYSDKTGGATEFAGGIGSGILKYRTGEAGYAGSEFVNLWSPTVNYAIMGGGVINDRYRRFVMKSGGIFEWGSGLSARDNILSRQGDYGLEIAGDVNKAYYFFVNNDNSGASADAGIGWRSEGSSKWVMMNDATDDAIFIAPAPWTRASAKLVLDTSGNLTIPSGNLIVSKKISSGQKNCSSSSDNFDVSEVNSVLVNSSGGDIVLGGLSGGVAGQMLIITHHTLGNNITLEHNEATGTQKFELVDDNDETLINKHGGWILVCDGTNWYGANHAKHF